MSDLEVGAGQIWQPFSWLGLTSPFFTIGSEETHVIVQTWIILLILFFLFLPVRWILKNSSGIVRYLILQLARSFIGLTEQAMGTFNFAHFAFITSIFIYILACNIISIIPWMEEPTRNLNTTLALGIISFLYVQLSGITAHGIRGYIKEYLEPFPLMAPLHLIGKIASIISLSFRLFGNIFGGYIISNLYFSSIIARSTILQIIGLGTGLNFVIIFFFVLFEGFLQAFVFTMLSLTYIAIAVADQENSNHGVTA